MLSQLSYVPRIGNPWLTTRTGSQLSYVPESAKGTLEIRRIRGFQPPLARLGILPIQAGFPVSRHERPALPRGRNLAFRVLIISPQEVIAYTNIRIAILEAYQDVDELFRGFQSAIHWAWNESNVRPCPYQGHALTN